VISSASNRSLVDKKYATKALRAKISKSTKISSNRRQKTL